MTKIDPHKHEERYKAWKNKVANGIPGISEANSNLIKQYVFDMELGLNISSVSRKGAREPIRLNTIRNKMTFFARTFEGRLKLDFIPKVTEEQAHEFFKLMRDGTILKKDGKPYLSTNYYVKTFKSFWHWYMKVQKKKDNIISDITTDLDSQGSKPSWVYLSEEQVKKLCNNAKFEYKVLMMFIYDSGIRSPTELVNVKVEDLSEDCKKLNIRDEISKTFGRKINLMFSSGLIKEYIKEKNLSQSDYLFTRSPPVVNKYLKRLAISILGDGKSLAGKNYPQLTMYDFRHSSTCYWLPRYKSESALKYRFGWKKSEMIHYYSEFLGMKDTISEEDMMVDVTKSEMDKRIEKSEQENTLLKERISTMEAQMQKILELTGHLNQKII